MTMRSKLIWATAGGLLVLGAVLVYLYLQVKADPPILIGDGSMVIESTVPLDDILKIVSAHEIVLKKGGKKIYKVKHTGSLKERDCQGKGCTIKTTWSNGQYYLVVIDEGGIKIRTNTDFGTWDTTSDPYIWRFILPSGATNDALNVTPSGSPVELLCSGGGCKVRIDYK
jgi:hypothetical protein